MLYLVSKKNHHISLIATEAVGQDFEEGNIGVVEAADPPEGVGGSTAVGLEGTHRMEPVLVGGNRVAGDILLGVDKDKVDKAWALMVVEDKANCLPEPVEQFLEALHKELLLHMDSFQEERQHRDLHLEELLHMD